MIILILNVDVKNKTFNKQHSISNKQVLKAEMKKFDYLHVQSRFRQRQGGLIY